MATSPKTFCLLTPRGRSAVATTQLHSSELQNDLAKLFLTGSGRPVRLKPNTPQFGFWNYGAEEKEGLVVCQIDDQTAEIHSHGGALAPRKIAESLIAIGYTELAHAEQNLKHDGPENDRRGNVWRSEIQMALSQASTRRTALALLELLNCVDEKLENLVRLLESDREAAVSALELALSHGEFGLHLTKPRSIVICGQPNVGKSSLINAVTGYARAIVHDSPGTTRDVVTEVTAFHGWPVELKDTAGIHDTDQTIENEGIRRARAELKGADVRIGMFDGSQPWSAADQNLLDELQPHIVVHNKSDQKLENAERPTGVWISALSGVGVENLIDLVVRQWAVEIPKSTIYPINNSQVNRIKTTLNAIQSDGMSADDETITKLLLSNSPNDNHEF